MSYQLDFDSTNRILRCRFDDHVTDEILKEFYRVATECFAQIEPYRGIVDFSAVTSSEVSSQTVCELAGYAPAMPDPGRVRVIVAPSDSIFGLARTYQFEGENRRPNLHVVRTLREAWAVLGVQDPDFERVHAA